MAAPTFDPAAASDDDLEVRLSSLAARVAALTAEFLAVVRELDRRQVWVKQGCRSLAQYLSWKAGVSLRAAQDHARVAQALESLPHTADALAEGRLSYSKARAITRMATPDTDEDLVSMAEHATAAQLDRLAAGYRRATEAEALNEIEHQHTTRAAHWQYHADGGMTLTVRLPADDAAIVRNALELAERWVDEPERAADRPQRLASCVVALAERAAATAADLTRADPVRTRLVLHAELDRLIESRAHGCTTAHGTHLHAEVFRRLVCDAEVQAAITDRDGGPIRYGRARRLVDKRLRRQLRRRDRHCTWPGCSEVRALDAHHDVHWSDGGATDADNLRLLCRFHHRFLHEGGCRLTRAADGHVDVRAATGELLASTRPGQLLPVPEGDEPRMLVNRWDGSQLHLGLAVSTLLHLQEHRARSAERPAA